MSGNHYAIHLFGGFELRVERRLAELPSAGQRLVSFLALHDRPLPRRLVAETLWPDADDQKATARLRTTLWRLRANWPELVEVGPVEIALSPGVWVDTRALDHHARVFRATQELPDAERLMGFRGDLLPGCWDSWLVFDRERLRYETIHLLEAVSWAYLRRGNAHLALLLGLCAVDCDPLRESSNVLVVQTHLAAGETPDAVRHARRYAALLSEELGVAPPKVLDDLLWQQRDVTRQPAATFGPPATGAAVRGLT